MELLDLLVKSQHQVGFEMREQYQIKSKATIPYIKQSHVGQIHNRFIIENFQNQPHYVV